MTLEQANYMTSGLRMLVSEDGLARHNLSSGWTRGTYVSQFESPVHGRMVIVNLDDDGAYGFHLGEIELFPDSQSRTADAPGEIEPSNESADSLAGASAPGD